MQLRYERPPKQELDRYKIKRKSHYVYEAAARLWAEGMEWQRALSIIQHAFDSATAEV